MKTKLSDYELATIAYHRDTLGVNPVAVDVASRVMQVCYFDSDKKLLKNFQLTRSKFFEFVEKAPEPLLFGIEACGSCNYLSRYFESKGHQCRIIPASKVKAFLKLDKNDKIDASGIFKAMLSSVESIPAKSLENQLIMNLLTIRDQLIKQHTQCINAAHGILYEHGIVAGGAGVETSAKITLGFTDAQESFEHDPMASAHFSVIKNAVFNILDNLKEQIDTINQYIQKYGSSNKTCLNLTTIPGIGLQTAVALNTALGDPERFHSARAFSAYVGVAPIITGTGGKITVMGIRKSGIRSIKKSLYMGAMVYLTYAVKNGTQSSWVKDRLKTKKKKVIICAIMNRLARIAYAMVKNGEVFDETKCNLIKNLR